MVLEPLLFNEVPRNFSSEVIIRSWKNNEELSTIIKDRVLWVQ